MAFFDQYCRAGVDPAQGELTGNEAKAALKLIRRDLISRFVRGQPFFTKDAIRDVRDQIHRFTEQGQKITVEGLDGVPVEFVVLTGRVSRCDGHYGSADEENVWYIPLSPSHTFGRQLTCLRTRPYIHYRTLQNLVSYPQLVVNPHLAFCNMVIGHFSVRRDIKTGKMLKKNDNSESTMETVKEFFQEKLGIWKNGQQCQSLLAILMDKREFFRGGVSNIVAFGCGSFTDTDDYDDSNTHSSVQHASLLTIREFLREILGDVDDVKILVQDPAYTPADKQVLQNWQITTVDDPDGFLELDDRSIVFSCSPSAPIKQIVTDICTPLMLICDTVEEEDNPDL
jgi:hypothetical protein